MRVQKMDDSEAENKSIKGTPFYEFMQIYAFEPPNPTIIIQWSTDTNQLHFFAISMFYSCFVSVFGLIVYYFL